MGPALSMTQAQTQPLPTCRGHPPSLSAELPTLLLTCSFTSGMRAFCSHTAALRITPRVSAGGPRHSFTNSLPPMTTPSPGSHAPPRACSLLPVAQDPSTASAFPLESLLVSNIGPFRDSLKSSSDWSYPLQPHIPSQRDRQIPNFPTTTSFPGLSWPTSCSQPQIPNHALIRETSALSSSGQRPPFPALPLPFPP